MVTAGVIGNGHDDQLRDSTEIFVDNVWRTIPGKLPTAINACVATNFDNRVLLFGRKF